jgi:hypothetical protein
MTVNCLLLPKAGGVPSWRSDHVGEKLMMKLPQQFEHIFAEDKPLDETTGRLLAEWARGDVPLVMPSDLAGLLAEGDAAASMSTLAPLEAFWKARTKAERDAIGRKQLDDWKARVAAVAGEETIAP